SIESTRSLSTNFNLGLGLFSTGAITEAASGSIAVPYVLAVTERIRDTAPITLTAAGNKIDAVTLSTLNDPGNPASTISFATGNGFQIFRFDTTNFNPSLIPPGQISQILAGIPPEFGINTGGDAVLSAVSSGPTSITMAPGSRIAAANLSV